MSDSQVKLNLGVAGADVATFLDTSNRQHQLTVIETQTGSADPVKVNASNPLPTTVTGSITATVTGTVATTVGNTVTVSGNVGITGTPTVSVSGTVPVSIAGTVTTTGGVASTAFKLISAATTNATSVKASAGTLQSLNIGSLSTSAVYVKLYNKASAPTVGTDTPIQAYLIPGGTNGSGNNIDLPTAGLTFSTGIALAITAGISDTDTTAVALNQVVVNLGYV